MEKKMDTQLNEELQDSQENQEEKRYSQEDVDEIVKKRLARERRKYEREAAGSDNETEKEKELGIRELKIAAKEKLFEAGLPVNLSEILKYDDEKTLETAIQMIKELEPEPRKNWGQRHGSYSSKNTDPFRAAMGLDRRKG